MKLNQLLLASGAIALLFVGAAQAADNTSTQTATLTITGECEVITAPIGASTDNFAASDVTLVTTGDYSEAFSAVPSTVTAPTTTAGAGNENVAVLCSAGGSDHTLAFSTTANMSDGATGTVPWTASLDGTAFTTQASSATITANASAATLTEYEVAGTVTNEAVADADPASYTADVTVTVTF